MVTQVGAWDYPVLYWLRDLLDEGDTVIDFGGHTGMQYYAYYPFYRKGISFDWIVCDVPAVVELGASRAHSLGNTRLSFTSDLCRASGAEIFFAAGSLQYVETTLPDMLSGLAEMPRHLIINRLPTQEQREIITLQNIGVAYCAYRLVAHRDFVASVEQIGYTLVDSWINPEERGRLPYNDKASPVTWRGYCFSR